MHTDATGRGGKPTKDPWCWAQKAALRLIRQRYDSDRGECATALATYHALTELASDKGGADTFSAFHVEIAQAAGVQVATVKRRIGELKQIGVIEVHTPNLRTRCTFKLIRVPTELTAMAHKELTIAHKEPALAQRQETGRELLNEETIKEGIENPKKAVRIGLKAGDEDSLSKEVMERMGQLEIPPDQAKKELPAWLPRFQKHYATAAAAFTETRCRMQNWNLLPLKNPMAFATQYFMDNLPQKKPTTEARGTMPAPTISASSAKPPQLDQPSMPITPAQPSREQLDAELTKVRADIKLLEAPYAHAKGGNAPLQITPEAKGKIQGLLKRAREIRDLIAGLEEEAA